MRTDANNSARIIDENSLPQFPVGISREQRIQINHGSVVPKESVYRSDRGVRFANDLPKVVHPIGHREGAAQGAKIGHGAVAIKKSQVLRVPQGGSQSGDLVRVVDNIGTGIGPAERSDIRYGAGGINEPVRIATGHKRLTRH